VIPNRILLALELPLCSMLIRPPALLLQSPGFTTGKLVIQSSPHTGANIFIDQNATGRQTNATFVVSTGTHWVAVTGGQDNLNCGGDTGKVQITSGGVLTLTCTPNGFQR
jgi:PEGA domain